MDRGIEDLKSLSFFGIIEEAYRLVLSWRTIFSKITLSLILPLCLIFFAAMEIANLMSQNIQEDEYKLHQILSESNPLHKELEGIINSKLTALLLFYLTYIIFVLIISLLSTSAVVYTVACIYVNDDNNNNNKISFSNVMYVVPKVSNRLIVTFLWNCLVHLGYGFAALLLLVGLVLILPTYRYYIIISLIILYSIGLLYINAIWKLASVVSVLEEDICGFKAIKKSMKLIKGKLWISSTIFFILDLFLFIIHAMILEMLESKDSWGGAIVKLLYSMACLLFLVIVILVGLVIQSVIYFVCKSYHNEKIDKTSLDDHLKAYLEEYVPLKQKPRQIQIVYS